MEPDNLTSNVNSFFLANFHFKGISEGIKEGLPIKNDDESSIVDKRFEISKQPHFADMGNIIKPQDFISMIK